MSRISSVQAYLVERPRLVIGLLILALTAALMTYAQTLAFAWDEGFHLLSAQLILNGKRPYLDYFFPQTPLNAYWNAMWMYVFGDTWRTAHAVAAVMVALSVLLTANFLLRRFPVLKWRLPSAISALFLVGLNIAVFECGTLGQAYAFCLFSIVAAFCLATSAVGSGNLLLPAGAGFMACAAANASLLTAPVGPVLLVWMIAYNRQGNRWLKAFVYAGSALIPSLPFMWLFAHGPSETLFNVFNYHFFYREKAWDGALPHDIDVMFAWLDCLQALLLAVLGFVGLRFIYKRSSWERAQRAEFYLCAWISIAEIIHISTAHPNFPWYYLLTAPFLAILSCAGLYAVSLKLDMPARPFWPVTLICALVVLDLGRNILENRDDMQWADQEKLAAKISEVTPLDKTLLGNEFAYFITRHSPYPGSEHADSHKMTLPAEQAQRLHILSHADVDQLIKAGTFDTLETDEDDKKIDELGLKQLYKNSAQIDDTWIFWDRVKSEASPQP